MNDAFDGPKVGDVVRMKSFTSHFRTDKKGPIVLSVTFKKPKGGHGMFMYLGVEPEKFPEQFDPEAVMLRLGYCPIDRDTRGKFYERLKEKGYDVPKNPR